MKEVLDRNLFESIIKYLFVGLLSGYILVYALRPSIPNPDIILDILENKFIFIILFIINYYLYLYDYLIATLFSICIFSLIFDYLIFIDINKNIETTIHENFSNIKEKILHHYNKEKFNIKNKIINYIK
jgi:hypothetical protein